VLRARSGDKRYALKRSLREHPSATESVRRDEHYLRLFNGECGVLDVVHAFWDSAKRRCVLLPLADATLAQRPPTNSVAYLEMARQLMISIAYIHERGVVHMDLKPQNMLLFIPEATEAKRQYREEVRLADFGSSLPFYAVLDPAKMYECTRAYRAPELLVLGPKRSEPSMDLWALGVLFWELIPGLFGVHPLRGAQNAVEQAVLVVALVGCTRAACEAWGIPGAPDAPAFATRPPRLVRRFARALLAPTPHERDLRKCDKPEDDEGSGSSTGDVIDEGDEGSAPPRSFAII